MSGVHRGYSPLPERSAAPRTRPTNEEDCSHSISGRNISNSAMSMPNTSNNTHSSPIRFPNHDSPPPSHFCFPLVGDGGGKASYLLSLVCEDAGNRYFLFLRFLNILCILLSISALVILPLANNAVCYIRTAQYLDILPFAVFQQVAEFQHVFWLRCIVYA